jgi:hypothetical protein
MRSAAPAYPLLDAPEDGAIEEYGWVPKQVAATPEEAVAWFVSQVGYAAEWINDEGLTLAATGTTSWHRQSPCLRCEGSGGTIAARPNACPSCNGTGEQRDDGDYISWEPCEATAEGAVEFWDLQVIEQV